MKSTAPLACVGLFLIPFLCSCHHRRREPSPVGPPPPGAYEIVATAPELLAALDRVRDAPNGTVILKPGYYRLSEPIRLRGRTQIVIAGSGWNTVLAQAGNCDALVFEDCHFCWVKDLLIEFRGGGSSASGIVFRGASSSNLVSCCRITGFPDSGVRFEGLPERPMSSNTVRDCHFIANQDAQLYSLCNNDFFILGNQFGTHGLPYNPRPRSGCVLDHSSAGTYTMNYHWGNVTALRIGPGSHFNRIENNRIEESSETGLLLGGKDGDPSWENIIIGNTIHTNSEFNVGGFNAVEAHRASDVIFSHNQVFSWDANTTRHRNGLFLGAGCRSWIVTDNIFRHHTDKAVQAKEPEHHTIARNIAD